MKLTDIQKALHLTAAKYTFDKAHRDHLFNSGHVWCQKLRNKFEKFDFISSILSDYNAVELERNN
jgi:polyisoprenoid-binding protein YceI